MSEAGPTGEAGGTGDGTTPHLGLSERKRANILHGDVIAVSDEHVRIVSLLPTIFVVGVLVCLVSIPLGWSLWVSASTSALLGMALWGASAYAARRRRRRLLSAIDPESGPQALAQHCHGTGPRRWSGERDFDVARYVLAVPAQGPRVVCVETSLAAFPAPDDIHEEVDIANRRALSQDERRRALVAGAALAILVGYVSWQLIAQGVGAFQNSFLFPLVCGLGSMAWLLNALGRTPLAISAAVASPGCVECAGWGGTGRFTRADSVLIVQSRDGWTSARLVRADGRSRLFRFVGDTTNPGLHQLLARWCCPTHAAQPIRPAP